MSRFIQGTIISAMVLLWLLNSCVSVQGKLNRSVSPEIRQKIGKLMPEEEWVIKQLAEDKVVDFDKKPNRNIRGLFLSALLTDDIPGLKIHFQGVRIKNAIITDDFLLEFADVSHRVELIKCLFEGELKFRNSHFMKSLEFKSSTFQKEVDLRNIKVDMDVDIENSFFNNGVLFICAKIGGQLIADHTIYQKTAKEVNFSGLKVKGNCSFQGAAFDCPVDFTLMTIGGSFYINPYNYKQSKQKAIFNAETNFGGSVIKGQFNAEDAYFSNKIEKFSFNGLKIERDASFKNCEFKGPVNFCGAIIKEQFILDNAKFLNAANFNAIKVGEVASFEKVIFDGPVDLRHGDIKSLNFRVEKINNKLDITGLKYKGITTTDNSKLEKEFKHTINLLERCCFNIGNYIQLEEYYKRCGRNDLADLAFKEGKRNEIISEWWYPINWLILIFWDGLAGYGRNPGRTFWVSLLIITIGAIIYNPRYLEKDKLNAHLIQCHSWVIRFLLSLDRFLPAIDLGLANAWKPKKLPFWEWLCWHIQMLFGWILIPIALAAIYTQIK